MNTRRMQYIDMAKGIGILLVIIGHTMSLGWKKDFIYSFHMPLFFVCSGMTLRFSLTWEEWKNQTRKLAKRLLLPIVALYLSMCWLVDLIAGITWNGQIKELIETRVLTMFMSSGSEVQFLGKIVGDIGALWFLAALFCARILLDAIHLVADRMWWIVTLISVGIMILLRVPLPLAADVGIVGMGYMAFGVWLKRFFPDSNTNPKQLKNIVKKVCYLIPCWLVAFVLQEVLPVGVFDMAKRDYGIWGLGILMAAGGSFFVIVGCHWLENIWKRKNILALLGRNSMYLLGIHYLGYVPFMFYGSLFRAPSVQCLVRLAMEVSLCCLLVLWKEKNKMPQELWWGRIGFLEIFFLQMNYLLFCRFPGGLQYDTINQLTQVVTGNYSNHHSIYHTMCLKVGIEIAEIFGGDITLGVFFFTVMQVCGFSYMVYYLLKTLRQYGVKTRYLGIILVYFLFFPYHLFFATYVSKDVLFTCCGVIFVIAFYRLTRAESKWEQKVDVLHMLLGGIGVALLRSNGFFAMGILFGIFLFEYKKRNKKSYLYVLGSIMVISLLLVIGVNLSPRIENGYESERYAIPIQQVSRVVAEDMYLSANEKQMIDNLCPEVSNMTGESFFQFVHDNYNPWRADEIKGQIQFWGRDAYFKEHKAEYTKLWITLGLRYPKTYLMAWMKMTNGYWGWKGYTSYFHNAYSNDLGVVNQILLPETNEAINRYLIFMQQNQVMKYLLHPSTACWLCVFLFFLQLRKKYHQGELYALPLIVLGTLLLAVPLNGEARYVYMLYGCLPFLAAVYTCRTSE